MALLAPFYLAIGDVIVEDGTGALAYRVRSMAFPEPAPDGNGGHLPATRTIALRIEGATASALSDSVAALRRECVRDSLLRFTPEPTGDVLECRIREASFTEASYDPLRRSGSAPFTADVTIDLVTDPYWLGPWSADVDVSSTLTAIPGHFDVASVPGEADALVTMRLVPTRDGRGLFVGVKPDPASGYDYLDDYGESSDTSDANALGTYKKGATADGTLSVDVAAPTIDTNSNRGRHILLARMDSNATTASSNTARGTTTTTGNAISASVTVTEQTVAFSSNDLIGYELGDVQIPAGQVPDVSTGSGWAAEAISDQQTTENADILIYTADSHAEGPVLGVGQTVALTAGEKVTGFVFKTGSTGTSAAAALSIRAVDGSDLPTGAALATAGIGVVAATTEKCVDLDWVVPTTANYAFCLTDSAVSYARYNTAGGYASGQCVQIQNSGPGWTAITGTDLYFKIYTQQPLGFNTSNGIQVACSESSKTIAIDYVQRIPTDYSCIAYRPSASGSLGLYYDGDTDTPYIADADGIGYAVYDKCEIRKPLRLKPGVTNRVVVGILQEDEAVAGGTTATYKYRSRWLTATG